MQAEVVLLYRVVQPGERVEWMQRVQGGKPLDVSQAPAKLQVIAVFTCFLSLSPCIFACH